MPAQRPQFLTIVCIIGFIIAGLGIGAGVLGYFTMKLIASGTMDEITAQANDPSVTARMEEAQAKLAETGLSLDQLGTMSLISSGLALVALIGMIMMWRLRRAGFYLFTLTQLVGLVLPLLMGGKFQFSPVSTLVPITMITLFGLNLKHMR